MIDLLMLIAGVVLAFWFIGNILGFLLMLLVAGLVGFAAEAAVPGQQLPRGWLGAIGAGLMGSFLGSMLIGRIGPVLLGVPLLPALLGAVVLVFVLSIVRRRA